MVSNEAYDLACQITGIEPTAIDGIWGEAHKTSVVSWAKRSLYWNLEIQSNFALLANYQKYRMALEKP